MRIIPLLLILSISILCMSCGTPSEIIDRIRPSYHPDGYPRDSEMLDKLPRIETGFISFSQDGTKAACALIRIKRSKSEIKIKSLETGRDIKTIHKLSYSGFLAALSPDTKLVASAFDRDTVGLWSAETGKLERKFTSGEEQRQYYGMSPDGSILVSTSFKKSLSLWSSETGKKLSTIGLDPKYTEQFGTISPDGSIIVTSPMSTVKLWSTSNGRLIQSIDACGHSSCDNTFAISPDNKLLAAGNTSDRLSIFSIDSGEILTTLDDYYSNHSTYHEYILEFSPDNKLLAYATYDGSIRLWSIEKQDFIATFNGDLNGYTCLAFSKDSKYFIAGGRSNKIEYWSIRENKLIKTIESSSMELNSIAWSPDGKTIAYGAHGEIGIIAFNSGEQKYLIEHRHGDIPETVFSRDGKTISVRGGNEIEQYSPETGEMTKSFQIVSTGISGMDFSPDNKLLAYLCGNETAYVVSVDDGKPVHEYTGVISPRSLCFSPDGKIIAVGGITTIKLWSTDKHEELHTFKYPSAWNGVFTLTFSPDSKLIAAGEAHDRALSVWNVDTGELVNRTEISNSLVSSVAFSPDNSMLAVTSSYGTESTLNVFSVPSWEPIDKFGTSEENLISVAFSPDSKQILTGSQTGKISIWSVDTGKIIRTMEFK